MYATSSRALSPLLYRHQFHLEFCRNVPFRKWQSRAPSVRPSEHSSVPPPSWAFTAQCLDQICLSLDFRLPYSIQSGRHIRLYLLLFPWRQFDNEWLLVPDYMYRLIEPILGCRIR